ncbi:hypothetical protein JW721_01080 [Candidatus Micrarchaeota archaeon]|nr:hypothetical protein [Candidatus Micrarchaeota archaeon]
MKTIEALICAFVLISFAPLALLEAPAPQTQLQQYQLAEDVWRIAYLKGCFAQDAPAPTPTLAKDPMEACLNNVIYEIEEETGLKIEFENLDAAGSELPKEGSARIQKTILVNGIPEVVFLKVGG